MNDVRRPGATEEDELRERAVASLKKKRSFRASLITYLCVNAVLVVIWAISGAGFFWPIFPILGWGIAICLQYWDAYRGPREISDDEISSEIERLRGGG
jgi:hypothetical protein